MGQKWGIAFKTGLSFRKSRGRFPQKQSVPWRHAMKVEAPMFPASGRKKDTAVQKATRGIPACLQNRGTPNMSSVFPSNPKGPAFSGQGGSARNRARSPKSCEGSWRMLWMDNILHQLLHQSQLGAGFCRSAAGNS